MTILLSCDDYTKKIEDQKFYLTAELGKTEKIINYGNFYNAPDTFIEIDVRITFNNSTDDTLCFFMTTCSYPDAFLISDTINFGIAPSICWNNILYKVKLPPFYKTDRLIRVYCKNKRIDEKNEFKIGYSNKEISKSDKVFWTNSLKMNRLDENVYK